MSDTPDPLDAVLGDRDDPRIQPKDLRHLPARDGDGYVLIVGVVHDHPASIFRSGYVVDVLQPDILALELPPVAIPLFESFSRTSDERPRLGGEMTAALGNTTGRTVGIDAPNLAYTRRMASHLVREGVAPITCYRVLRDLEIATLQAAWTIVAAVAGGLLDRQFLAHTPVEHEATAADSPTDQARDEDEHIATRKALLEAIEVPEPVRIIDTLRETVMADRVRTLRRQGDVVVVVGVEHLDPVFNRLSGPL